MRLLIIFREYELEIVDEKENSQNDDFIIKGNKRIRINNMTKF